MLKRNHNDTEIEALAQKFRESWSEGQVIRSWLRNHSAELRKLVREEDWSWANVGRALSAAGIQFKTGKGWTGENVRRAVDLATKPRKTRETTQPAVPKVAAVPVSVMPASAPTAPKALGEPEFRIIRRGPGGPVRTEAGPPASEPSKRGEP